MGWGGRLGVNSGKWKSIDCWKMSSSCVASENGMVNMASQRRRAGDIVNVIHLSCQTKNGRKTSSKKGNSMNIEHHSKRHGYHHLYNSAKRRRRHRQTQRHMSENNARDKTHSGMAAHNIFRRAVEGHGGRRRQKHLY